ncbi:hypothetical protein LTS10_004975 [Elasticomyces elasticus]|nr:hypothetical protein LTS10_004975 [Elasticomyces elasticus]
MVKSDRPPANAFVAAARKIYNPIGFSKGYNFVFFFIAAGYLFGFTLSRLPYFDFHGVFCHPNAGANGAAPGECYYWLRNPFKIGMQIHLYTILPSALLVCLQFVPVIRHKVILLHRLNGYLVIALSTVSSAGAIMILPHSFGGEFATQTMGGVLVISTTLAYIFAIVNIKLLQIDQHRAWMLRAWAYFSIIITLRMIQFSSSAITARMAPWYTTRPCAQIVSVWGPNNTMEAYPGCQSFFDGTNPDQRVVVKADFSSNNPIEITAGIGLSFGAAGFLALWIHAIIVEVYLRLTPAESERLRQVSYERQLARGFKRPGYAGLTAGRFGDAPPFVPTQDHSKLGEEIEMLPKPNGRYSPSV